MFRSGPIAAAARGQARFERRVRGHRDASGCHSRLGPRAHSWQTAEALDGRGLRDAVRALLPRLRLRTRRCAISPPGAYETTPGSW